MTQDEHSAHALTRLALRIGDVHDGGGDAPEAVRAAVAFLGLSEEEQTILTDVVLVAHGLLVGHDATESLCEVWEPVRVRAAADMAVRLLGDPDSPSPT